MQWASCRRNSKAIHVPSVVGNDMLAHIDRDNE